MNSRILMVLGSFCVALCLIARSVDGATAAAPSKPAAGSLPELQTIYRKALDGIVAEHSKALAQWPSQYLAALGALQTQLQKKGDLDGWQAVKKAVDHFKANQKIGDPSSHPETAAIQSEYRDRVAVIELEKSRNIIALTGKYLPRLNSLQTTLTQKGQIEEALRVNAEIKQIQESAPVKKAEFIVSEHEAKNPPKVEPPPADPPPQAKPPTEQPPPALATQPPSRRPPQDPALPPTTGNPGRLIETDNLAGFTIHDGKPPTLAGYTFKRMILRPTAYVRTSRRAAGSAEIGSRSDESTQSSGSFYSSSKSKQGSTRHRVRLNLRSTSADSVISNSTLAVEYYVRNVNAEGKITPERFSAKRVKIPAISAQGVLIDTPEIETYRSSYRYSSAYSSGYKSQSGEEFYGVIISVFDSEGALYFQVASEAQLADLADKAIPEEVAPPRRYIW